MTGYSNKLVHLPYGPLGDATGLANPRANFETKVASLGPGPRRFVVIHAPGSTFAAEA